MKHDELIAKLDDLMSLVSRLPLEPIEAKLRDLMDELEEDPYVEQRARPETDPLKQNNIEFITHLMDFGCPTGALIQPYVMAALEDYSARVIAAKSPETENGFVSEAAWRRTAEHVKEQLDARYKK